MCKNHKKFCNFAAENNYFYKSLMNMKTMKSLGVCLVLALVSIGFSSCDGEDYHSRLPELIIKNLDFSSGSDTQEMTFRNEDLTNYGISADAIWCTPWIDYDKSIIYVKVTARGEGESDDAKYDERTCTVTLTDVRDNTIRTFTVSQKQTNAVIVNGNKVDVESSGGDVEIEVKHNIDYQVSIPEDATWVTLKQSSMRGLVSSKVILTVGANNSGAARSTTVLISSTDGEFERKVTITQSFTPVFTIDTKSFTVDELSQTLNIGFSANFKFDAYPENDWLNTAGREAGEDDTHFVQKINVSAFTEKKESRTGTLEFYANVLTAPGVYREITETVTIIQERTLYIPVDTVTLMVGDSTVIEVYNKEKRDLVWSSSDNDEFTVNSKGQVKCVGAGGDFKATITVQSKDGKYSDKIIAIAKKPTDLSKYLVCKWDSTKTVKEGVSTTSLIFKISNNSQESISLTRYAFYKDSLDVSEWSAGDLSETLSAKGSRSFDLGNIPTSNYYMTLKYTYRNDKYTLGFSKSGVMTIKKEETTTPAATRRSARSRRK